MGVRSFHVHVFDSVCVSICEATEGQKEEEDLTSLSQLLLFL